MAGRMDPLRRSWSEALCRRLVHAFILLTTGIHLHPLSIRGLQLHRPRTLPSPLMGNESLPRLHIATVLFNVGVLLFWRKVLFYM